MATSPNYASTAKTYMGQISAANPNRDGTGTIVIIATAGASGSRIDHIRIVATGTTTAGMVRLFVSDGVNHRLFAEIPIGATTPSATVQAFSADLALPGGLLLQDGYSLRAATEKAEVLNVIGGGGDF